MCMVSTVNRSSLRYAHSKGIWEEGWAEIMTISRLESSHHSRQAMMGSHIWAATQIRHGCMMLSYNCIYLKTFLSVEVVCKVWQNEDFIHPFRNHNHRWVPLLANELNPVSDITVYVVLQINDRYDACLKMCTGHLIYALMALIIILNFSLTQFVVSSD